ALGQDSVADRESDRNGALSRSRKKPMVSSRRLILSSALLLAVSVALSGEDSTDRKIALKDGDRIIFFGDSLTELAGTEKPKKYVTKGYVRIVAETLRELHKDKKIEVDWVATGGHTVPDLLKRV